MNPQMMTAQPSSRDSVIDWLKGISIIFVLIWHFQPIQINYHFPKQTSERLVGYLIHIINTQILCLAVPTFILISLYLFISKIQNLSFSDGRRRLFSRSVRMFSLYFFYLAVQFIIFFSFRHLTPEFNVLSLNPTSCNTASIDNLSFILENLFSGGPSLPVVGYSVLYFLLDLAILTIISFLFNLLYCFNKNAGRIIFSAVILLTLILFELSPFFKHTIYAHQIENFILYVPIALIWVCYRDRFLSNRNLYFMGYLLFSLHDLLLDKYGFRGEMYSRISIVFGALTFISFAYYYFSKNIISLNPEIHFMSSHSLGIFAIHKYSMLMLAFIFEKIGDVVHQKPDWEYTIFIGDIRFRIIVFFLSILSVWLTIAFVGYLGKTKLKPLVM